MIAPILEGLQVLIVEDQYYVAMELKRLVLLLGGDVLGPAPDTQSASILLEQSVDLAILDVNLNGEWVYPLAETLRIRGTPLILATGYEAWALDSRFTGDPMVCKPVTLGALTAAILRLNAEKRCG